MNVGIDAVDVERFRRVLARRPALRERLFTESERTYAERRSDPTERFAARFAAKEAVMKALGVGIGSCRFTDIEIVHERSGAPALTLHGRAAALADERGITDWRVSLTHTDIVAQAVALALP